jgi:hypothetical protein
MNIYVLLILITIFFIFILTICFEKNIKKILLKNTFEGFEDISKDIGLKWIYNGDIAPSFGDKINNEILYNIIDVSTTSPVIITKEELSQMNIENISYNTYISVGNGYYKPYNSKIIDHNIGLKWRSLGKKTDDHVEKYYTLIKNVKLQSELEKRRSKGPFEYIYGENIIIFTSKEFEEIFDKNNHKSDALTYDSYIKVGEENIFFQPYYTIEIGPINHSNFNLNELLANAFDKSFTRSTSVRTYDLNDNSAFNNSDVSNAELNADTIIFNHRAKNEDIEESILNPIDDKYLPFTDKHYSDDIDFISENKINEFVIINVFRTLLGRQPVAGELRKNLQKFYEKNMDEDKLKMQIYNSGEYKIIVKMQSNDIEPGLVKFISQDQIIHLLTEIYKELLNKTPREKMLYPLYRCYIHLQYNDYLFKALIINDNFLLFEKAILREYILTDQKLLLLFNEHFILQELRLIANELKRTDLLKRKAVSKPIANTNNNIASSAPNSVDSEETKLNSEKHINDIVKNSDNIFNINIVLGDNDLNKSYPYSKKQADSEMDNKKQNENTSKRIYDPITYKQQYRGDPRYRPNVCSYGTKQIVNPVFVNSTTLFNGTDLDEAINNTQVGSIMPKFEYREYEDID